MLISRVKLRLLPVKKQEFSVFLLFSGDVNPENASNIFMF
jgi:hypothetical protein